MNNLQLSVLISSYAEHLRLISNDLAAELDGKVACQIIKNRGRWIGEGENALQFSLSPIKDTDWEWTEEEGRPLCFLDLDDFITSLNDAAENLREEEKSE